MSDKTKLALVGDWLKWGKVTQAFSILDELPLVISSRVRDAYEDEDVEGAMEMVNIILKSM